MLSLPKLLTFSSLYHSHQCFPPLCLSHRSFTVYLISVTVNTSNFIDQKTESKFYSVISYKLKKKFNKIHTKVFWNHWAFIVQFYPQPTYSKLKGQTSLRYERWLSSVLMMHTQAYLFLVSTGWIPPYRLCSSLRQWEGGSYCKYADLILTICVVIFIIVVVVYVYLAQYCRLECFKQSIFLYISYMFKVDWFLN